MARKWMQGVAKNMRKGALTEEAARHGETPGEFCAKKRSGKAGKRCALRKAFKGARHGRGRSR